MDLISKFRGFFDSSSSLPRRRSQRTVLPSLLCCNRDPEQQWQKVRELGGGSEARVFEVRSKSGDDRAAAAAAAAKIIDVADVSELPALLAEVHVLTRCAHANVVRLLECHFFDKRIWIVEELCGLGALDSVLGRLGRGLRSAELRCVARQTLLALRFIHDHARVIHRDVKAGNLLLDACAHIKLADFGVAAELDEAAMTRSSFIGSSYWMAPEVIVCETGAGEGYSFPADVWSFGVTLIELVDMHPPHHTMSQNRVLIRILKHEPPTPRGGGDHHPPSFAAFLALALHKDPRDRWSAAQLLEHEYVTDDDAAAAEVALADLLALTPDDAAAAAAVTTLTTARKLEPAAAAAAAVAAHYWVSPQEAAKMKSGRSEWAESDSDSSSGGGGGEDPPDPFAGFEDPGAGASHHSVTTIQSSPIDVYDHRPPPPPPYVVQRTAFFSAHGRPPPPPPPPLDKAAIDSLASALLCELIEEVLCGGGGGGDTPSVPEAIFSVINELADQQQQQQQQQSLHSNSDEPCGGGGGGGGDCIGQQQQQQQQRGRLPVARREELRTFRRQYQLQSQRLDHLKAKQANEVNAHDHYSVNARKTLIERLNEAANQLHHEQRQEMQRAESEVSCELKLETKRKKNAITRHQKLFGSGQSSPPAAAAAANNNNNIVNDYVDNLKAYHMTRLANLDNSFTKKRHQLKRDQLEEMFAFDERSLCDKFRLLAGHVKHYYAFVRDCMLANQQKELEELDESSKIERQYLVDELNSQHRGYIKYMKQVKRSRERQFKQSLGAGCVGGGGGGGGGGDESTASVYSSHGGSPAVRAKQLKEFSENENIRIQSEMRRREEYMRQKLDQMFVSHQRKKAQLQCQQAEKRAKCADKEAQKLAQLQRAYQQQLHDLQHFHEIERSKLGSELSQEVRSKEAFYRSTVQALSPLSRPTVIKVGIPQQSLRREPNDARPEFENSQQF